ncbi:pectate lyase, partial [Streptomyces parvulus]|nr:pectate lyase [Streptomyces parvulus]
MHELNSASDTAAGHEAAGGDRRNRCLRPHRCGDRHDDDAVHRGCRVVLARGHRQQARLVDDPGQGDLRRRHEEVLRHRRPGRRTARTRARTRSSSWRRRRDAEERDHRHAAADGVHCKGSCTLQKRVVAGRRRGRRQLQGHLGLRRLQGTAAARGNADDKVLQFNGAGKLVVSKFQVRTSASWCAPAATAR